MSIPLAKSDHPDSPAALLETLREVIGSGRWKPGEYAISFEQRVAELCGTIFAIATTSGSSSLEAVCHATGLQIEDEVICPSYISLHTVNALLHYGVKPIFADIDPWTFGLDVDDIPRRMTDKTRAILLVHQYGIPAHCESILSFCDDHDLFLIEDATCGLGSAYKGKPLGTFGRAGLLSFHPRKLISDSEGGMVVTDDESIAVKARTYGPTGNKTSEFQAAIGLWALDRVQEAAKRRVEIAQRYQHELNELSTVEVCPVETQNQWNAHSYPLRVPRERRDLVVEQLQQKRIGASIGIQPAHMHPYIVDKLQPPRLPETERAAEEVMLVPIYAAMTPLEQQQTIKALRQSVE